MGRGKVHTGLSWENLREGDYLEDPGIEGNIILKWRFERLDRGHKLDGCGHDRVMWRALVITVMNLRFP
jgi:hypothetical protein